MNFSTVIDRLFDGTSRIGNDACDLTNRNKENIAAADYMLENFSTLSPFNNALNLAFNQPNIVLQGSPKGGTNGDYVDANNVLTFGQGTNMRERGLIQQRIFNAVPYLGKGPANTPLENTNTMYKVINVTRNTFTLISASNTLETLNLEEFIKMN